MYIVAAEARAATWATVATTTSTRGAPPSPVLRHGGGGSFIMIMFSSSSSSSSSMIVVIVFMFVIVTSVGRSGGATAERSVPPSPSELPRYGNLRTKILDFRGFDSSRILSLRGGILMSLGHFPEMLSQRILAGILLVGRLGVSQAKPPRARMLAGLKSASRRQES